MTEDPISRARPEQESPGQEPSGQAQPEQTAARRRRRRRRRAAESRRRRFRLAGGGIALLALALAIGGLAAFRYLPALDDARALETDLIAMASRAEAAGLGVDRAQLNGLSADLSAARARLDYLAELLATDPLVGLARIFPPTAADVRGADALVGAARDVFEAADQGLAIGGRFVEIKEARATAGATAPSPAASPAPAAAPATGSALAQLVELMATSRDQALAAQAAIGRANEALATVPDGLAGVVEHARDAMRKRLDRYGPLLDAYVAASARLPAILGWDGPRLYLVLTQNPAELRPTGGYIGSYGIIAFDRGRVTERTFRDIFLLDLPWSYPFIEPPTALANYLLGPTQPWQLADANWSPDFPTSAQDAIRLYTNESGDSNIDGVLGITTYTIDALLKVTGPISVPEYEATIASGETTLKTLQLTRSARETGENRKAFLSTFADRLFAALFDLPPRQWGEVLGQADTFRSQRLLLAWVADPAAQAFVADGGFDGAIRQDPGDYLYPVDSNVAPASKLNAITTRSLRLDVVIDSFGNARNTLDVTWENPIEETAGKPYRELPTLEHLRTLGMYFRVLAPAWSRVESVSGGSFARLTAPAEVGEEAGRTVIGVYLRVPPGSASLRYVWTSPFAADADRSGGTYRLTIQKQPGLLPGPLALTIQVPPGFLITAASEGLAVSGGTATLQTSFSEDLVLGLRYAPATPATSPAP